MKAITHEQIKSVLPSLELMPAIEACLKPGGLLVYETFHIAHRASGRGPRRDAFYLESGELPGLFPG